MTRILLRPKPTARELLVHVAGDEHDMHTVVERRRPLRGTISFKCSCGQTFKAPLDADAVTALRNVPNVAGGRS